MNKWLQLRLWLRRRWDRMDARLVGTRQHKVVAGHDGSSGYTVYEYMVEVPGPGGGAPVRLSFKEQTHRVRGYPQPDDIVPVVVNKKRTKAMFNFADPRIDNDTYVDEQIRKQKERDDKEFAALRAGREPTRTPEDELP